jgi:hypothetical protein
MSQSNIWFLRTPSFWGLSAVRNSKQLENTKFRKLDLFPSSGERKETPALLSSLSPLYFLIFKIPDMDKVQKPGDPEWYTP